MNNALLYFGGFLVVMLAALFAVPSMVDWNGYRGVFEEEASKVLGRDVRVSGAVNLRLLPTPYVKFEKVRLADVSGQTGEPFIRAESFTMWLAVSPLMRGVLEANKVELDRPVLNLALDGQGGGNWSSIRLQPGTLPFVPRDVTLHSVKLIDGTLGMYNAASQSIVRVEQINGELSADGLAGPFRFAGTAAWGGEKRDIRFSTTAAEGQGGFRIKAATRGETSKNSLVFDGSVEGFTSKPKLTGELTGAFPLPMAPGTAADVGASTAIGSAAKNDPVLRPTLELTASASADASGGALKDVVLSVANAAEPQTMSGSASARWTDAPRLDVHLTSKWLDLDKLAGGHGPDASFEQIKTLTLQLLREVAGDGKARARIDLEQVKIAGETVGGLKIDAERSDGVIRISQLNAGLPGGSRLLLSGDLKNDAGQPDFSGQVFVHGTSLARLKAWAHKSGVDIDIGSNGEFSIDGRVRAGANRFDLTEASVIVGGRTMTGDVSIIDDGHQRAEITIESAELDSADVFPTMTRNLEAAVASVLSGTVMPESAAAPASIGATVTTAKPLADLDITLRVLAGELRHNSRIYRDVDVRLTLKDGDIRIASANFATASGLTVHADGGVQDARSRPKGTVAFDVTAADAAAMRDAVALFDLDHIISAERAANLPSMRLAGLLRLGQPDLDGAALTIDGMVGAARVSAKARFEGGLAAWRSTPSEVHVTVDGDDIRDILVLAGGDAAAPASSAPRATLAAFTMAGILDKAAVAAIDVDADGLKLGYSGSFSLGADNAVLADGTAAVTARDVRDVLGLAGLSRSRGMTGAAVDGRFDVAFRNSAWTVASRGFGIGGATLSGTATVTGSDTGRSKIEGDITANRVSVAGLLAAIVDDPARVISANPASDDAVQDDTMPRTIWPEGRFDFTSLANVDGHVRLAFDQLIVSDALTSGAGKMTLAFAASKLALNAVTAQAAGGQLTGDIVLEGAADGVSADANLRLERAEGARASRLGTGQWGFDIAVSGRAQSPAALMAVVAGRGTITTSDMRVAGPNLAVVRGVAEQVLAGKLANDAEAVSSALSSALAGASVDIGTQTVAVTLADGSASMEAFSIESADGRLINRTSVDLLGLGFESSWRAAITPPARADLAAADIPTDWAPTTRAAGLSPVLVSYRGSFDEAMAAAGVPPVIDASVLPKELVLLQAERQVEDLERIRRLDEQRARLDQERRKAQAAERAAARASRDQPVAPPPVIPESAHSEGAPSADPSSVIPSDAGALSKEGATSTVTVQPTPPTTATNAGDATGNAGASAPLGAAEGLAPSAATPGDNQPRPAAAKPRPPRPAREAAPRITPGDEIMRSLRSIP